MSWSQLFIILLTATLMLEGSFECVFSLVFWIGVAERA